MNPQEINILLNNLVSIDPNKRFNAAIKLQNVRKPLLLNIFSLVDNAYKQYSATSGLSGNPLNFSAYGDVKWVLGFSLVQSAINSSLASSANQRKDEYEAAIDGAWLYISVSCVSIHAGLIELIKVVGTRSNANNASYAQSIVCRSTKSIEPLIDLIDSENEGIRATSIYFLIPFKDIRSYEPIKRALKDESEIVRNAAAVAIKELGINVSERDFYVEKETIHKIVMVPCKYCGTLNENTDRFCQSCGAPLT